MKCVLCGYGTLFPYMKFPVQAKANGLEGSYQDCFKSDKKSLSALLSGVLMERVIFLVMRDECMNLKLYICKYNYMIMTHA